MNQAIGLVKSQALTTDNNLNGLPDAGDVVTYSYTVTNSGDAFLTNVTVIDDNGTPTLLTDDITVSVTPTTLAVGEATTGTLVHTVTQAEFDSGSLTNIATASGTSPTNKVVQDTATQTVSFLQSPAIQVDKTARAFIDGVGNLVTYDYTVTNIGNVTLTNVTVTDDNGTPTILTDDITVSVTPTTLAPNGQATGTATHTISQADVDDGSFTNVAKATGTPPSGPDVTGTDPETVNFLQSPAIQVDKTARAFIDGVGNLVTYDYTVTNTGNVTLTNVTVTEDNGTPTLLTDDITVSVTPTTVAPGAQATGTATHTISQADVDNSSFTNVAEANSDQAGPVTEPETVTFAQNPAIQVVKTARAFIDGVNNLVTYDYTVTNTGNVTLTNVTVTDDNGTPTLLTDDITVSVTPTTVAPGAQGTGTATHTISQADVYNGSFRNVAKATGTPPSGPDVTSTDPETVTFAQSPAIQVDKTARAFIDGVNNLVTYDYTVTNTGNVTLTNVTVTDDNGTPTLLTDDITVSVTPTTLAPGAQATGTAAHTISQADIDNGSFTNVATTTGTPPSGPDVTGTEPETVTFTQSPGIAVVKTARTFIDGVGNQVTYDYTVTNTGNVTLTNVTVTDDNGTPSITTDDITVTVTPTTVTPGAQATGTATHTISQADIDNGSFTNVAEADSDQAGPVTEPETVTFAQNPAIQGVKTARAFIDGVNNVVTYDYTVTNTGNVTLTNVTVTDDITVSVTPANVAPGAQATGTATHTISQADVDNSSFTNVAEANSDQAGPVTEPETVTFAQNPAIQVVKTARAFIDGVNNLVTYDYTVTDDNGTPTLLTDDITVSVTPTTVTPGAQATGTATHTISQADVDNGSFTNEAEATGTPPSGPDVTDTEPETVTFTQNPAIQVVKTASPQSGALVGQEISYGYTVTNTGNVTLFNVTVDDDKVVGAISLSGLTDEDGDLVLDDLAPGATSTGSATHTVTAADINAGSLTNVGTATGTPPSGPNVTGTDSQTVTFVNLSLAKSSAVSQVTLTFANLAEVTASNGSPDSASATDTTVVVATDITYTLVVTNNGNADATNVTLTDTLPSGVTVIANPNGGTQVGNTITWDLGTVAGGGSQATVSVTVRTQTQ